MAQTWKGLRLGVECVVDSMERQDASQILEGSECQDGKFKLYLLGSEIPSKV